MKVHETDVLVVGAGPGGSMAARFAARNGARTLLIEKRQEIGAPVRCAEGISKDWMAECDIREDPSWIAAAPDGARIFSPDGTCAMVGAERAGNEVGVVLERNLFDKAMARLAAEAGAEILLKTYATDVIRDNGSVKGAIGKSLGDPIEIRADVVIGADGFESQVGRWAGIDTSVKPKDIDATIQYRMCNIDCDPRYCDFYVGSCAPGGYIWIFPKGNGVANVGIGVQLSLCREQADVKRYLDEWIAGQPGLARGQKLDIVGGAVSTNKPLEQTVGDGIILVGDAARVIDPLTGGGIINACLTGKMAGEVAAEAVRKGDTSAKFLARYDKAWRKRLEKKLLRNYLAKEKVAKLDDETFNSLIKTLSEVNLNANTLSLLMAIGKKHPKLVADFSELMFV